MPQPIAVTPEMARLWRARLAKAVVDLPGYTGTSYAADPNVLPPGPLGDVLSVYAAQLARTG